MKNKAIQTTQGIIQLTNRNYLASGGQAAIYRVGKTAYKVYHDQASMIPVAKMQELAKLSAPNVIKPLEVVYDQGTGEPAGYAMAFVEKCCALCKLFTRTFKDANGLGPEAIVEIVKDLQETVSTIHSDRCLVVDLNELNVLVPPSFDSVVMIDTDSYQTPNHKATAIMESILDPTVQNGQFTRNSDWFSFAVLAFQLYINIHPYKGRHPQFKITEWKVRMKKGISAFDPEVKLPVMCNPLQAIPPAHRKWMEGVFTRGERGCPPLPDASEPVAAPEGLQIVQASAAFHIEEVASYDAPIVWAEMGRLGLWHVVTTRSAYQSQKIVAQLQKGATVRMCSSASNDLAIGLQADGRATFYDINGNMIGTLRGHGLFIAHGCFHTVYSGCLLQISLTVIQGRLVIDYDTIEHITELAFQVFEGVVIQDLLGHFHASIPAGDKACVTRKLDALHGYRVVDAKAQGGFLVVVAEHKGRYDRFYYAYQLQKEIRLLTREDDVAPEPINFTVKANGLGVLATGANIMKLFAPQRSELHEIADSPVDSSTRLCSSGNDVYFAHGNTLYQINSKNK